MFGKSGDEVLTIVMERGSFLGVFVCGVDDGGVKFAAGCADLLIIYWRKVVTARTRPRRMA